MSFAVNSAKAIEGPLPYTKDFVKDRVNQRAIQSAGLCIDSLSTYSGIDNTPDVYPPSSLEATQKLVGEIEKKGRKNVSQSRAIFYIFSDFSEGQLMKDSKPTVAQYYASQMWMSNSEQSLVLGLWQLDANEPEKSLPLSGCDWNDEGYESLHDVIVDSLFHQKSELVVSYLAARSPQGHNAELVSSSAANGKFIEVLEIAQQDKTTDCLHASAIAAVSSKAYALELAQLACMPEQWEAIQEQLEEIAESPDTSEESKELVHKISLVRASHLGDNETSSVSKGVGKADSFSKTARIAN